MLKFVSSLCCRDVKAALTFRKKTGKGFENLFPVAFPVYPLPKPVLSDCIQTISTGRQSGHHARTKVSDLFPGMGLLKNKDAYLLRVPEDISYSPSHKYGKKILYPCRVLHYFQFLQIDDRYFFPWQFQKPAQIFH